MDISVYQSSISGFNLSGHRVRLDLKLVGPPVILPVRRSSTRRVSAGAKGPKMRGWGEGFSGLTPPEKRKEGNEEEIGVV